MNKNEEMRFVKARGNFSGAIAPEKLLTDKQLTHAQVRIWLAIRDREGYSGDAFPSIKTIATDSNSSAKTVHNAIHGQSDRKGLIELGWLKMLKRKDSTNLYECYVPIIDETLTVESTKPLRQDDVMITNKPIKEPIQLTNNKEINSFLKTFKDINPSIKYNNKTQRKALQEMINEFGLDELQSTIDQLPKTNREQYAPTITTPYELQTKWAKLHLYLENNQSIFAPNQRTYDF